MARWNRGEHRTPEGSSEDLPVDILPASNGEFVPPAATSEQKLIMARAEAETERYRKKFGMNRREFVRSAAAMAIGFWAVDSVGAGRFGRYSSANNTETTDACDLQYLFDDHRGIEYGRRNLPGEFVFDVQSHHVDPEGAWRVTNPAFHAAFAALWSQSSPQGGRPAMRDDGTVRGFGAGEVDPINNLSRFHYMKELFLDSATNMTVLSAVPTAPDEKNPLPLAEAAATVRSVNHLAQSQRSIMHAFAMPNRGAAGNGTDGYGLISPFVAEEFALMEQHVHNYGDILAGWKIYPAWGDVPYASGWFLDSPIGHAFLDRVEELALQYGPGHVARPGGLRPVIACHKGFALPGFDQRAAAPKDVGPAAAAHPGVKFIIYHSGHDIFEGAQGPYDPDGVPEDPTFTDPRTRTVNAFIKSVVEAGVGAPVGELDGRPVTGGCLGHNSPNVYAELGSVWRDYMGNADQAAHLLGKLINHIGPARIVWGTDSLWYGSPHREIVALRLFEFTEEGKALYNLPHGLDGDYENPQVAATDPARSIRNRILGRNAAEAYGIDADATRNALDCDLVNGFRESFTTDPLTERERSPFASNSMIAPRTPAQLVAERNGPWAP